MHQPNQDTFTMKEDITNNYTRTAGVNQAIIYVGFKQIPVRLFRWLNLQKNITTPTKTYHLPIADHLKTY